MTDNPYKAPSVRSETPRPNYHERLSEEQETAMANRNYFRASQPPRKSTTAIGPPPGTEQVICADPPLAEVELPEQ